jgi:general secretion pathway protein E
MPSTAPVQSRAQVPAAASRRLGELLVERQLATGNDVAKALAFQQQFGGRLGSILVRLGALSEETLLPLLAEQLGIPLLDSAECPLDAAALRTAI